MVELMNKYKKGKEILIGNNKAIVTSDLIKFKDFYAIYADITLNADNSILCNTYKIHDKVALIIRDKKRLLEMRINFRRKKSNILS
jgi:hypothetical protein